MRGADDASQLRTPTPLHFQHSRRQLREWPRQATTIQIEFIEFTPLIWIHDNMLLLGALWSLNRMNGEGGAQHEGLARASVVNQKAGVDKTHWNGEFNPEYRG